MPVFETPRLLVDGAQVSPRHAARIRDLDPERLAVAMRLLGLQEAGDPIRLVLAPEDSLVARSAPPWIAGYAFSDRGAAVLFPARTPAYPDSTFEELVLHEVGHILVYRAADGREVPLWFNEGLALFVGRPWRLEDRSRVTWALVSGRMVALADLERYFDSDRVAARHAYALAGAFVHDLLGRRGADTAAEILAAVAVGSRFEDAFLRVTGESLAVAEASFWRRHTFWYRWLPVLTSSVTLWIGVTVLALFAIRRRRAKDTALKERWEREEARFSEASGDQPPE
jgi:hypothetical protein